MAGIVLPQLAPASEDRVSGAQVIDGSLKFDRDAKTHLHKTFTTIGSSSRFTWSYWIKRTKFGVGDQRIFSSSAGNGNPGFVNWFTSNDVLEARHYSGSAWDVVFQTTNKFRDTGWYHIVCTVDVTESAATDRVKIYVNGTRETLFNTTTYGPAQYAPLVFNGSNVSSVGSGTANGNDALDAHLSNYYAIDGFALGPESFGFTDPLTGVWRPKKFSGELNPPFSDNWEGDTTGTGFNANTNKQNAFDGNPDSQAATGQNGTMSFTPTPAITGISKVRIKARRDAGANVPANFTLNGTTIGDLWTAGNVATVEITSLGGSPISQLTNLTWKGNTNNNEWFGVYMIEVYSNGAYHTLRQGGNAFYLPMDGDSPVGIDQSGKGNDFQPRNFGGSNSIEKATGARPILNTLSGGRIASAGVFGSKVSATYTTTSASNSGGKYVFENEGTQPTFSFVRGATYTFDWSASSGHPLRFATAADAAGSTEYTDGTNVSGNVTKITVPHNAPDTLYYYCNVHNGMGNSISVTTDETAADPYAWKNVLAMPLLGNKDDKSTSINCTQSAVKAITANGAVADARNSNFYGGSYLFDGSNDYLSLTNSGDFAYGTGDFTIETWIYPTNITNYKNFYEGNTNGSTNASVRLQIKSTGVIEYLVNNVGRSTAQVVPANEWTHVALTRASNTVRLFINGVNVDEYTNNGDLTSQSLHIGKTHDNYYYVGHIQDYRVYKGVAKYTSNFIPASTSPDVLPDSPSSTALKGKLTDLGDLFTTGAVSFDGSGDYLDLPTSSDFGLAGGDNFTIECFVFTSAGSELIRQGTSNAGSDGMYFSVVSSGALETRISGTTKTTSGKILFNNWNHISVSRSSGTLYMSINGVVESFGSVTNASTTGAFKIGSNFEENSFFRGHISNVRFIKGTGLYTSNFNPPTESLTNVTNTKLLCCQSNTSATAAAVIPTGSITANGNASATTFNPFKSDIDAVRGQEGNYCTLNPLTTSSGTFSKDNLRYYGPGSWKTAGSTMSVSTGKWYYEVTLSADPSGQTSGGDYHCFGWGEQSVFGIATGPASQTKILQMAGTGWYKNFDGTKTNSSTVCVRGDVLSIAVDLDANTFTFRHNNNPRVSGTIGGTAGRELSPIIVSYNSQYDVMDFNFGQKPFKFPPPDGYQPLTSSAAKRNATDTIPFVTRPNKYQGPLKYTGKAGGTQQDQDKIAFTPDMVWVKRRNAAEQYKLYDTVRGKTGSNFYHIEPNNNTASAGESGAITEMLPGGFYATGGGHVNSAGEPFIAWMWRAGGGNTTGSASNEFWKDGVNVGSAAAAQVSAGSQNSSAYDTSDVWSDDLSSPNGAYSNSPVANAFNGNLTNGFEAGNPSNNYSTIRFQPASPITVNTQIRIHVFDLNDSNVTYQWRVNDGSWNNMPGTSSPYRRWQDLSFTGSLTSFEYRSNTSVTYKPTLYAVEIDGKLLINAGTDLSGLTQYPTLSATACSIGTKQGFSICQYTSPSSYDSSTWAHGLSQAPDFIMSRMLNAGGAITIYHSAVPSKYFLMNSNAAGAGNNNWTVTSGTVTMGAGLWTSNNQNSIAYHWHNVPGLQKFGKYTCNGDGSGGGDEDGPFVELGFRPAMILFKGSNYTSDYTWIDNERCTTNYNDVALRANYHYGEIGNARGGVGSSSQPENYAVDFLSNGFKVRASGGSLNSGTNEVWYAAWAEAPAFNLFGAQSNAR